MPATFSVLEIQLSPFLLATFSKKYLQKTELTDALHENAGFHTDFELMTPKTMAGILRRSKGL